MSAFPFPKFQVKRDTAAKVAKVAKPVEVAEVAVIQLENDTAAKVAKPANFAETEAVSNQAVTNTQAAKVAKVAKVGSTASRAPALSQSTATTVRRAVAPAQAVTTPLPNRAETPDPARHDRRCSMCANFNRSYYGPPLGLCAEHGNRIQHSSSEPMRFGCGNFDLKQVQS